MSDRKPVHVKANTVTLPEELARYLFTYNCDKLCAGGQAGFDDLKSAIEHYIVLTARRDGYYEVELKSEDIQIQGGMVEIPLQGVPDTYVANLAKFMNIGVTGLEAAKRTMQAGIWQPDWSFFLTWSMGFQNHKAVQVLHFPPITVPNGTHDDLLAATTIRWGQMLEVNGAETGSSPCYQSIVDILPIGAPADAAEETPNYLDKAIPYFNDYSRELLAFKCLPNSAGANLPRPIVVFGGPATSWFQKTYAPNETFKPLDLCSVTTGDVQGVPALAANHPSEIFYPEPRWGEDAKKVMLEDVIAAKWEVEMSKAVADGTVGSVADMMPFAQEKLQEAKRFWCEGSERALCEIYWETTFDQWPADAKRLCCG